MTEQHPGRVRRLDEGRRPKYGSHLDGNVSIAPPRSNRESRDDTLERRVRQGLGVTPYGLQQRVRIEPARQLRQRRH
ncbi:hypothetical protein ACX9NE_27750 [Mycobacterium sp. ML4]